jgi:geranylgeranylglycerol-phosphate geranylgeranyltransferase
MNSKVSAFIELSRPVNLVIGIFSVFIGAFISGTLEPFGMVMLACLSGALMMAAGNAVNDYCDVEIDRINKPFRPLPANRISRHTALNFSIILFVLAIFLSILISKYSFLLALSACTGLLLYSGKFKKTVLLGNITVSFLAALAFVYGGAAVARLENTMIPAGFAFLFHLGREIIKDVEDRQADAVRGARTLPVIAGDRVALLLASLVYVALIVLTFVPYRAGVYGSAYFWIVLLGVDFVLLGIIIFIWIYPVPKTWRTASALLKADMFVGLFAIYMG